ncbi:MULTISPECIES: hypothetical protein [unclassified Variovorax]|uniref:hypothetical protein n=1 Tax=unclassified Variovorax TaxID=663243 RepID=UPI003F45B2E2
MSQPDIFDDQITILRAPSWLGQDVHEERALPLAPGDYKITPGERWTVTSLKTNEVVYDGIGPVEIRRKRVSELPHATGRA